MQTLEELVQAGKIRHYGWSTDDVARARLFAGGEHCTAIEHRLNVFNDNSEMLSLCQQENLASLNRVPLLMGLLTGRWTLETKLGKNDPRAQWFEEDNFRKVLACVNGLEPYLTSDGRSYVQGALSWIWARSPISIPLPGFRNRDQMVELIHALEFGPLPQNEMRAVAEHIKNSGIYS